MHLFIIEHYTNFDNLAPVIYKLSTNNKKVFVCGTHPVKSFRNDVLLSFLNKNDNFIYDDTLPLGIKEFIFHRLIKILSLLPKKLICGKEFWTRISKKIMLMNEKKIIQFINDNRIKSISVESSLLKEKQILLKNISTKAKIPLIIFFPSSNGHVYKKKIINKSFSLSDYNIISNKLANYSIEDEYKNYYLGMPRYNLEWFKVLEKIYSPIYKKENDKIIRVAAFSNKKQRNYQNFKKVILKLKNLNNVEIIERNKPKDDLPEKCSDFQKDKFSTTQLIQWCDVIIFNMNTSIFVEALFKNKKIFYLKTLDDFHDRSIDDNYFNIKKIFYKFENDEKLEEYLNFISNNPNKKNNQKNYNDAINEITSNNFYDLQKFYNFYKNLEQV